MDLIKLGAREQRWHVEDSHNGEKRYYHLVQSLAEVNPEGINSWSLSATCSPCSWATFTFLRDLSGTFLYLPQNPFEKAISRDC